MFKSVIIALSIMTGIGIGFTGCSKFSGGDSSGSTNDGYDDSSWLPTDYDSEFHFWDNDSEIGTEKAPVVGSSCPGDTSMCANDTVFRCVDGRWKLWAECFAADLRCVVIDGFAQCLYFPAYDTDTLSTDSPDTRDTSQDSTGSSDATAEDIATDSQTDTNAHSDTATGSDLETDSILADSSSASDSALDTGTGMGSDDTVDDTGIDSDCLSGSMQTDALGVTWVQICGGTFLMGSETELQTDEAPIHPVLVYDFEIARAEITSAQYAACVASGECDPQDSICEPAGDMPVGCVDWTQAHDFCEWAGGRLPSEAEWEYAARNEGEDIPYPWCSVGDTCAPPSCGVVVMDDETHSAGCDNDERMTACSLPAGNTAQGLCDMIGNSWEWVADAYVDTYPSDPTDSRPYELIMIDAARVARGGSMVDSNDGIHLRATDRLSLSPGSSMSTLGFRCAR